MFLIVDEEMFAAFVIDLALNGVDRLVFHRLLEMVGKLPGGEEGSRIVFYVYNVPTSFEDEDLEAFFAKFFCSPAAADTGSDYDRIELLIHTQ